MQHKNFDIIIWGASGFTGRLVAEYLLQQYGINKDLKWAMAGRNQDKLEQIRTQLGNESIPILIADSMDISSLNNLVKQTKVICTTVGPYAKYGSLLVEACIQNGIDYCDLTGEVQWIRRMIDQHHEQAMMAGVKIVHCCGFDSIPSDMGVYFLQKEAKARKGKYCQHIKMRVKKLKGGISGGTYASLSNVLAEAEKDKRILEILEDPYNLNPAGERSGLDTADMTQAKFDEDFQAWISPFVMATINTRIVRRSHALAAYPYGKDFRYEEATLNGKGMSSKWQAKIIAGGMNMMSNMKPDSMLKKVADRFLPKPGEGPSKHDRETGFYKLAFLGKFEDGTTIQANVTGDKDPGYGSTSKMLGEAAVCLAKDRANLLASAGILTASTAMGDALLRRLETNAGLTFSIKE